MLPVLDLVLVCPGLFGALDAERLKVVPHSGELILLLWGKLAGRCVLARTLPVLLCSRGYEDAVVANGGGGAG